MLAGGKKKNRPAVSPVGQSGGSGHVRKAFHGFGKVFDCLLSVAVFKAVADAVLDMPFQNDLSAFMQGGFGGVDLRKDIFAGDMATLDRVKNMEIAADLSVWQDYALHQEIHPAVRTYLTVYPEHFYNITNTDRGQLFVTARGWEDLSCILLSYEETGETVNEGCCACPSR